MVSVTNNSFKYNSREGGDMWDNCPLFSFVMCLLFTGRVVDFLAIS